MEKLNTLMRSHQAEIKEKERALSQQHTKNQAELATLRAAHDASMRSKSLELSTAKAAFQKARKVKEHQEHLFREAARRGDIFEVTRILQDAHMNIHASSDKAGEDAMAGAVRLGLLEMISFLHSRGAKLSGRTKGTKRDLLAVACRANSLPALECLVHLGLVPDSNTLHTAVQLSDDTMARHLVTTYRLEVNYRPRGALNQVICKRGDQGLELMRFLLEHAAELEPAEATSPLSAECRKHRPSVRVATLLLEHGARITREALELSQGKPVVFQTLLSWRGARRLWTVRSANACMRLGNASALRKFPKEMTRMVGDMLGEEQSRPGELHFQEESSSEEEDEDEMNPFDVGNLLDYMMGGF
jgi:hypothetical protein